MTPDALAALHAAAFTDQRPWSAVEFTTLLASPHVYLIAQPKGFALGRVILDEVELLTIATAPDARRQGIGRTLLAAFEAKALNRGARMAHLEVAADNRAARALYAAAGWEDAGRRPAYYPRHDAPPADALLMQKRLP